MLALGASFHWTAKSLALLVGLALGAASVISLFDGTDVFGIFAANGPTKLAWGACAVVLLVIALLPRVGGDKDRGARRRDRELDRERVAERDVAAEREGRFTREPVRAEELGGERRR